MPVLVASLVACVGFWVLGWLALDSGHPNEDAYILFKYVDNLVGGHGIVFYPGGPPTEGATDFLWLLLLSASTWMGADVALAAVLWNGLGAGLAAAVLSTVVVRSGISWQWMWCLAVSLFVLLFHGAIAAMSGFSTMLFSALMLSGCMLVWERKPVLLPVLGLVLVLFRPEGVVPGVAFVVVGWFQVRETAGSRRYLLVAALCFLAGLGYLGWHRAYFGLWLPLSVHVKFGGSWLPGLGDNLTWLRREFGPLPFLIACGWILLRYRPPRAQVLRCLWAVLPALLLLLPLTLAVQTQNVRWRFQAPITLAIAWFTWKLFAALAAARQAGSVSDPILASSRTWVVTMVLVLMALAHSWALGMRRTWQLVQHPNPRTEYTATFAPQLGDLMGQKSTLMLTEAGILAYWNRSRIVDVVGLNDARFVGDGVSVADVAGKERPAVVMFNAYEVLDLEALRGKSKQHLLPIDRNRLAGAIRGPSFSLDPARHGARALAGFLAGNDDYHLRVVFLGCDDHGRNNHVYGFRKDHPKAGLMLMALASCTSQEQQPSYLEVRGRRR